WTRLRALWMELEFTRLLKDLPAPVALVSGAPGTVLSDRAAVVAWVASVPAGEPLALDWAGEARPPDPSLAGVAIFHPAAGAARLAASDAVALGGREVLIHDAKPVLEAWLGEAATLPPIQDSAVAADLLNPARAHGAPRHPRRSRAPRGVREGARAEPRQPHAGDLAAGRRGVHDRVAEAARPHPLREARAARAPPHEDRLLDRRRRPDRARAR